jgi:hypothetical protein
MASSKTSPVPQGTELSVVIPWVHINTTKEFVNEEFTTLGFGEVLKIQLVYRKESERNGRKNPEHYKAFIHLGALTEHGKLVKQHLEQQNKEIKVNHNFGFWLIQKSAWSFVQDYKKTISKPKLEFL